jgi:hypothetical protein
MGSDKSLKQGYAQVVKELGYNPIGSRSIIIAYSIDDWEGLGKFSPNLYNEVKTRGISWDLR